MSKLILWSLFATLFVPVLAPSPVHASLSGITANNQGVKLFEKQRQNEAYAHFAQSLGTMPFDARVHFNLASSYLANKEYEKAMEEFEQAARLAPKEAQVQFAARFNAAVAATELKQIDQALALYQSCLDLVPDSLETKTNIELLIQSQGSGGDKKDDKEKKKDDKGDKDKKKEGDGDKKDEKQPPKQPDPKDQEPKKNQPRPFDSKDLTQQDAARIMDELKRQEELVRARFTNDHVKDVPRDKDW
jgi:Ca-activated chloride channel family protein